MTIQDCIQYIDSIEPNAYNNEQKARWVRECEGKVYTQLYLQQTFDFPDLTPWAMMGLELSIPAPYNKLYPRYLQAMIHYANGEYERYAASMQLFNEAWSEVCRWFGQDFNISDRARNHRITVRIDPGAMEQTLLTVPPRCAFVAGRIVIRDKLAIEGETALIQGNVWFGKSGKYVSNMPITMSSSYVSSGIKLLLGDIGGTDIGLTLDTEADSGEAWLTGVLCIPEEQLLFGSWEQRDD
ncbi:MAG: hypothetical protein J6Y48_21000 [Clostridia bacterium]|nr:hypothetical protein [Clostridia bacterium]